MKKNRLKEIEKDICGWCGKELDIKLIQKYEYIALQPCECELVEELDGLYKKIKELKMEIKKLKK